MVGYQQLAARAILTLLPPSLQTCSEVGEERDEFSPIRSRNTPPKEGPKKSFIFFLIGFIVFFIYMCKYLHMYKISSMFWATGGSAEQPLQVPGGRALSQPMPHPSGKTE